VRYWTGATIAFFLAIFQASSVEQFKALGVSPNLLLVFLVAWLVVRGLDDVLPMIFVAGVTFGLVGLQSPGLILLALLPIAGMGAVRELHIVHSETILVLGLVFAASLAYETVIVGSVVATGGARDLLPAGRSIVLPAAVVNLALTLPVYLVMRLARPAQRQGQLSF
jgi:uncharacterized membrane protein YjgN (DUF898 family)